MSQVFNTASVAATNSEKLFISTATSDADTLELEALKALVRDNIVDGSNDVITAPVTGSTTDVSYDLHTVNMINQDIFSSQIHIVHTTYVNGGDTDASFLDVSCGTVDLSQIEIDETTASFVEGTLIIDICNGADDISLSDTLNNNKHNLQFTGTTVDIKTFHKALLSASENVDSDLLLSVVEDDSNNEASMLNKAPTIGGPANSNLTDISGVLDVVFDLSSSLSIGTLPIDVTTGVYNATYRTDGLVTTTIYPSASAIGMRDLCGNILQSDYDDATTGLAKFVPGGIDNVPNYYVDISVNVGGSIAVADAAFDIANFSNMANNLDYMNAIRDYGNNKNVLSQLSSTYLDHTDVSSHNILITNSITDLSFGEVNDVSHGNGSGDFKTFLNDTQDEFLSAVSQGEIKLYTRPPTTRIQVQNNDDVSNVLLGSTVAYVGDTPIQGTTVDLCLNDTETVTYTVKQAFPNPGSSLLDSLCVVNGNQSNTLTIKDTGSSLFANNGVTATINDDNSTIATLQASNTVTFIKVTDNNKFATRVNKLFDLVNTNLSYSDPDVQIDVTGTNVELNIGATYDKVRLFLQPKTLADLSNAGQGLVADASEFLSFSTTDSATILTTKVDYSNKFNDFTWDIIDYPTSEFDLTFSIVPNETGTVPAHEFQSKIQTLLKKQWTVNDGLGAYVTKEVVDYPSDYTLTELTTQTVVVDVGGYGTGTVKKFTKTTTNSITDPFPLSAYENIQIDMSNITIVDVYYEWYHNDGTKGPESKLHGWDTESASRTITYTPQVRKFNKSMIHTMTGQLQGRTQGGTTYSTTEPTYDIDFGYNLTTTISGFNNNTAANFIVNMDLDEGSTTSNVSLKSAEYELLLDFSEGNEVYTTSTKTGTLDEMMSGLTSLQDIFTTTGFTANSTINTVHEVNDNTGVNTLKIKNGSDDIVTLEAATTLLANFVIVVANGPVFNVLRNGDTISFDNYIYTDTSYALIDNGIQLDICENLVNFGNTDMSFHLLKDQVGVSHYGSTGGVKADINENKSYTDVSAQEISFNNYRGIIADQTIEVRRVLGQFQLDFSGVTQSLSGDFLVGTQIDASMTDFNDISMGDLGYDIISNKSHLGTANVTSSIPITLTPTQYKVTGTVPDLSANYAIDKTSFSDILFEFYQNDISSNDNTDGFFKASNIAGIEGSNTTDRFKIASAAANQISITNPAGDTIGTMSGAAESPDLVFSNDPNETHNCGKYPFKVQLKSATDGAFDVSFSLEDPKFKVQYRNPSNVNHFPFAGAATSNTSTEYLSAKASSHDLTDISATITLDVASKTYMQYAFNRDATEFKTDMSGLSSTVRAQVTYDVAINPGIANEYLVISNTGGVDTSSVAVSIDQIGKVGNVYQLAMTQQASGLYTADSYDVCSNFMSSSSNILVKLPSAYMNEGRYQTVITPNTGVQTSLIGAEYDLSGVNPVIKIRKYTSPIHESFETFKIDHNNIRAVAFRAHTVEEATVELDTVTFGTSAYSFQSILNSTADNLTLPTYTTVTKDDISGEPIWDNYDNSILNYVMVPLTYAGIGNILEVTGANSNKPVKTLVASTPDITRITSADGAPVFRVRANGRIDTGTVQTSNLVSVTDQTSNSGTSYNSEFVSYNVLLG